MTSRTSTKKETQASSISEALDVTKFLTDTLPANNKLLSYAGYYLKKRVLGVGSPHTARARRLDIQKFITYFYRAHPSGEISLWDLATSQAYERELESNYAVSTVNRHIDNLSSFAGFLEKKQVFSYEDNPVRHIQRPDQPELEPQGIQLRVIGQDIPSRAAINREEIFEEMAAAASRRIEEHTLNGNSTNRRARPYRDLAIMMTLYYSGLRVEEVCSLTREQMKAYEDGCFFKEVKCKGNKRRNVFVISRAYQAIRDYIKEERLQTKKKNKTPLPPYIFLSVNGRKLNQQDVWRILDTIADLTNPVINTTFRDRLNAVNEREVTIRIHPHSFRHERAYKLLRSGKFTESDVKDILGHTTTKYIARYTKETDKERVKKIQDVDG